MGSLQGKVAVVTGAGRRHGLGRAYALALAAEGCRVVVDDIDEGAETTAREIRDAGGEAAAVKAPVGSPEAAKKIADAAVEAFGRLDILINNAGVVSFAPLVDLTEALWDQMIRVHLSGTFFNTQAAARWMIANGVKGRIINTTSPAGLYGIDAAAHYCAAKAGIVGLTKQNAIELAPHGICVNAVSPSAVTFDPAKPETIDPAAKETFADLERDMERRVARSVVQRPGVPDDVAPLVTFLASDRSYYITGQIISATGNPGIV